MRLLVTNILLFILLLPKEAKTQNAEEVHERLNKAEQNWLKLMPKYGKMQFAGGMGVIAVGMGWDYGKKKQWETDFLIGVVPRFYTEKVKISYTLKQNYIPFKKSFGGKYSFEPLTTGLYVNTIMGNDYWVKNPDRYPDGYYTFSTKLRFHVFAGQRVSMVVGASNTRRRITAFYELSTNDLYLFSGAGNSYLNFFDFNKLSLGLKFQAL